ncbi:MAG: hypothetical protein ACJ8H8_01835 [Geminicoccaceae bacterium]
MKFASFTASLQASDPPPGLSPPVLALWHAARGEWDAAHAIAQQHEGDPAYDWVHAHLHRVEGDLGNAGYWYRRAGRPVASGDLAAERERIAQALLATG